MNQVGEGDDPLSSTPDSNQVDMLDAMVTQGRLRQLLHQSMSADKKVARDGKVKITEFLKNGNTLLPITADEMRQHSQSDHFVPAATPASADDAASAGSSGGSSDDNLIEYQEFVSAKNPNLRICSLSCLSFSSCFLFLFSFPFSFLVFVW